MEGYIYCITDTTNGKQYIGQHHYDKEELDPTYHGSGIIISRIFEKRPETLKEEYLKTCYSQKELDEWEKYFIFTNETLYPNGYNLTKGGEGVAACEETRRKISESNKGKTVPEERRKKISESVKKTMTIEHRKLLSDIHLGKCSGENHYLYGKHLTDETRNKLSVSHTNGKQSKPVLQYTLGGDLIREWPSTNECGRNGFNPSHITRCCNGLLKSHKGYIWKYKYEYDDKIENKNTNGKCSKQVLQYTLDGNLIREWPSLMECSRNGFNQANITSCCQGKRKSSGGYIWKYKEVS